MTDFNYKTKKINFIYLTVQPLLNSYMYPLGSGYWLKIHCRKSKRKALIMVLITGYLLKGHCHEDFAVLDQFWAKIITLRLCSLTKCFSKATTKISNEFYQRGLTIIKFLRIF